MRSSVLGAIALAATITMVSACSSDGTSGQSATSTTVIPAPFDPTSTTTTAVTAPPDAIAVEATTDTSVTARPLDALAGRITDPTELKRLDLEGQQKIAACMSALGWQYQPYLTAGSVLGPQDAPIGSRAFGSRYGYGVVATHDLANGGGPLAPSDPPDPNQPYLDSLSAGERTRYDEALHGTMQGEAATGGCDQQALRPPNPADGVPGLLDRVTELQNSVRLDSRMQAAVANWLTCVTTTFGPLELAGRPVSEPSEMRQYVQAQLDLASGLEVYPIDLDDAPADLVTSDFFPDGTWYASVGTVQPVDPARLEQIRADETRLWTIDDQCQSQAGIQALQVTIESEFVAQLQAEYPQLQTG